MQISHVLFSQGGHEGYQREAGTPASECGVEMSGERAFPQNFEDWVRVSSKRTVGVGAGSERVSFAGGGGGEVPGEARPSSSVSRAHSLSSAAFTRGRGREKAGEGEGSRR